VININIKKLLHFSSGKKHLSIDLKISRGSFISVFGKSGAGKTTLFRILAGLTVPDDGSIQVNESLWYDSKNKINLSPQKRGIGYVFQDFALFPNMSVKENLYYALGSKQEKSWVDELLEISGLTKLSSHSITNLSGGQQQRVALARALVRKPEILLLDEPLSSLDFETRSYLQDEILKIHRRFGLTTILISHDKEEIIKMSDYIFHLEQGDIIESGKPQDIFSELPAIKGIIQNIHQNQDKTLMEIKLKVTDPYQTKEEIKFDPGQEVVIFKNREN
jgi:molybdate transport system ATP-binding protein